jgi:SRSO17 transposase
LTDSGGNTKLLEGRFLLKSWMNGTSISCGFAPISLTFLVARSRLGYAMTKGHTFLDRRIYLPKAWCSDLERRKQAKVPDDVIFRTKPEQAMTMLEGA